MFTKHLIRIFAKTLKQENMKKLYTFLFLMALVGTSQLSFGQFYDGFTGTGNIGGNCADASCNNNGWYTHSNTAATTIDIVAGNLEYTGLQASTGNKIYLTGNTLELKRDINAAVSISGNEGYYSALINLVDTANLSENAFEKNYFMHFASEAGNTFSANQLFARLAATATGASTYRLGISTGSVTLTTYPTDLNCGTTYLIVVKYDKAAHTATLWVNPTSFGGSEPTGGTVNSDANTVSGIASICIRNGYSSVASGGTPKMYIDEVRVGTTWAEVVPSTSGIESIANVQSFQVYPNPASSQVTVSVNENIQSVQIFDLQGRMVNQVSNVNAMETNVNIENLSQGIYNVVVTSNNGTVYQSKMIK